MSLQEIEIKKEYRSLIDNVARDFYVPLLNEAVSYKRAVGYFSSSVLVEISKGIIGLIKNGGTIQIIASPDLSEEDVNAIRSGYAKREEIIERRLLEELKPPVNSFQADKLNLLANLIADGYLDIKIAVTETNNQMGIYHEKMGLIQDSQGNVVAFSGSMNETASGLKANYETIDVYTNWTSDADRVESKMNAFKSIWNNVEPNVRTLNFDSVNDELIRKYKKEVIDYESYPAKEDIIPGIEKSFEFFKIPESVEFYDYQKEAITSWFDNSGCGIFDMATGTGKTFTALGALSTLSNMLNEKLAVIIVAPYKHLVEQWVEDIKKFNVSPIIAYDYKGQNWRKEFKDALLAYNVGSRNNFCVITTNATFQSDDFQAEMSRFKKNFCFVADEAHNLGAKRISELLPKKARYRLALSATIERHRDDEGSGKLKKYFGKECISFTLKEAIKRGFLTPYYYYPIMCYLDDEERDEYKVLTDKIVKQASYSRNNEENSYLERLLIQRARIVAGCHSKVDALLEHIEPYKDDTHMLIYCGATKYDRDDLNDEDQIRQIDEVTRRLYKDLKIRARKFTSSESNDERTSIKRLFVDGAIQAITAIKCLDEGVNIPKIRTAFILASSTNPKEYIQRRGRVLRKAEGKDFAVIYDFITLPRLLDDVKYCSMKEKEYDLSLVEREFERMLDFADTARNPADIDKICSKIQQVYKLNV